MNFLNTTSGFPAWGSDKGSRNPQGIWPQRPVGFTYRTSTGLGETSEFGEHKQNLARTKTQKKSSDSTRD